MSRTNSGRANFKADSLLDAKLKETNHCLNDPKLKQFMTLTFLGFYDKRRKILSLILEEDILNFIYCSQESDQVSVLA